MVGLENKIKNLIECLYQCEYDKKLEVVKTKDGFYKLTLYLHEPYFGGLVIANQCETEEDFLKYVEKELITRRLDRSDFTQLKIYANIETQEGF